jgi:hypothetical protein
MHQTSLVQVSGRGVETQVSMGAYRPYRKTSYWTCCSAADFRVSTHFAVSYILHILHFRVFMHLIYFTHLAYFAHFAFCILHFHALHIVMHFAFRIPRAFRIFAYFTFHVFAFSRFSCFDMRYHAPT